MILVLICVCTIIFEPSGSFSFMASPYLGMSQITSTTFPVMIFLKYFTFMSFPTVFSELAEAGLIVLADLAFKHFSELIQNTLI